MYQRPATVIGFSSSSTIVSTPSGTPTETPNSTLTSVFNRKSHSNATTTLKQELRKENDVKFIYVPVSILTALERLQLFISTHSQMRCEVQEDETDNGKYTPTLFLFITF